MSPQILERIVGPRLLVEHMDHYRAVIQQNPSALVVPFNAHPLVAELALEHPVDLFADGMQLAATIPGGEHEIVKFRRHAPHIEHGHIAPAVILRGAGGGQGELLAACLTGFNRSTYFSDGDFTSIERPLAKCGPILTVCKSEGESGRGGEWESHMLKH